MSKRIKKIMKSFLCSLPMLYIAFVAVIGFGDFTIPDKITVRREDISNASVNVTGVTENSTVQAKLFGVIPVKDVNVTVIEEDQVAIGGNVFGIKFFTKGVMIIRQSDIETSEGSVNPAKEAGLCVSDVIVTIDNKEVNTVEDVSDIVRRSYGKTLDVEYIRDGKKEKCKLTPVLSLTDKSYKTGLWVRDSTAGIGTVTYIDPATGSFAGLGHGICDVDTGKLMPLLRGSVVDVEITDIIKGKKGMPGEIKGSFDTRKKGVLTQNSDKGVYGVLDGSNSTEQEKVVKIALGDEVQKGKASIFCELDDTGVKEYEIEIEKINKDDKEFKNLVIKVTDERLIDKTGGIVQGMSGSPILQNGRIVGAVTHVFVNDPTRGYGIFIENMLDTAS